MCVNESLGKHTKLIISRLVYDFAPVAFCSAPAVPTGAHISDQSTGLYPEGTHITLQCDDVSHTARALTTVCYVDGSWRPLPSELDCTPAISESGTECTSSSLTLLYHCYNIQLL